VVSVYVCLCCVECVLVFVKHEGYEASCTAVCVDREGRELGVFLAVTAAGRSEKGTSVRVFTTTVVCRVVHCQYGDDAFCCCRCTRGAHVRLVFIRDDLRLSCSCALQARIKPSLCLAGTTRLHLSKVRVSWRLLLFLGAR